MPVTHVPIKVPDAATYTVLARDSGLTHIMPDLTADIVITLPDPRAGLEYRFIYGGNAIDVQDWQIFSGANANFYLGGLLYVDDNPTANSVIGDGDSNCRVNILTPEGGTDISLHCDGTNWFLSGVVASANAPTFADIS